jgi:hypothetical protein
MNLSPVCVLLLLAACGGDDGATPPIDAPSPDAPPDAPPGACGELPPGSFSGTVAGTTITSVRSAIVLDGQLWEVGLLESSTCGQPSGTDQNLDIQFCAPPGVGTHPVVAHADHQCPGAAAAVWYIDDDAGRLHDATGGSVTFTAVGPCTSGSFDITFAGAERVTGEFNAAVCVL